MKFMKNRDNIENSNMKAITAVCATGASVPAVANANGRIARHRDGENAEIKMYLSKLKDLVPSMPKNRKLSKLEIIQHVIDYICDLQSELETHPAVNNFDPSIALNNNINFNNINGNSNNNQQHQQQFLGSQNNNLNSSLTIASHHNNNINSSNSIHHPHQRQPLCDRPSPNTILSGTAANTLNNTLFSSFSTPSSMVPSLNINSSTTSYHHNLSSNFINNTTSDKHESSDKSSQQQC